MTSPKVETQEKKDCAFQYATSYKYISTDVYEDTGLITLTEAKELWRKYLPQFISQLEDKECKPEMAIWINMESSGDYGEELAHVDWETETDGTDLFVVTREKIVI